jgi:tight adherence protein B
MNIWLAGLLIFVTVIFVTEMFYYAYNASRNPFRGKTRRRLKELSPGVYGSESPSIIQRRVLSDVPLFNDILQKVPGIKRLHRLTQQANTRHPVGFFVLLASLLATTGFLITTLFPHKALLPFAVASLSGVVPFVYLLLKKKKRLEKLEEQLPGALDLIARALRAGHAFSSGMHLAAQEFDDPIGTEFDATLDEINFGIGVAEALKNLAHRLNCTDLKFFVVSVLIQRETGGNLAEVLENIAHIIRERFKLRGKIKVLSAEGKLSAVILILIPFVIFFFFNRSNPDYINTLFTVSVGKLMVVGAAFLMITGIFLIKKIITIKV